MWRAVGAAAALLSISVTPALAEGPMSPIALAPNTFEATSEVPRTQPPTASQSGATTGATTGAMTGPVNGAAVPGTTTATAKTTRRQSTADASLTPPASGAAPEVAQAIGGTVPENNDPWHRHRSRDADQTASSGPDPDHMAGALNRIQLDQGDYGSGGDRRGHGPVPLPGAGN